MAPSLKTVTLPIATETDIVVIRQTVRLWVVEMGCSLVEQTKFVTAASELARNALVHGGGGEATLDLVQAHPRRGVRVTFSDRGPGIPDIEQALRDGFTTGNGMGLGLGGAKRLANDFHLESVPGQGTTVSITKWK